MASLKDQGNEEFKKENYLKAAALYTQAIKEDPENAVLYSNRSAALLKLKKVTKALEDADTCIKLKSDWDKAYVRKAAVLEETDKTAEALEVYQKALTLNPSNKEISLKIRTLSKLHKVKVQGAEKQAAKEESLQSMIESATGGPGPCADFARDMFDHAAGRITEHDVNFKPTLHFMPGPKAESHEPAERNIATGPAFQSPELLADFISQMRGQGARFDAQVVVAVVPRTAIAYPQTWLRKGWPCGKTQDGVFIQLETLGQDRHVWYMPVQDKVPGIPIALDVQFAPLPNMLR